MSRLATSGLTLSMRSIVLTRTARWVFNSANVPRLGRSRSLLLDLAKPQVHAALNTQRTLLVIAEVCFFIGMAKGHLSQGVNVCNTPKGFT